MLTRRVSPMGQRTACLSAQDFWMCGTCFIRTTRDLRGRYLERTHRWGQHHLSRELTSFLQKAVRFRRLEFCAPEQQQHLRPITLDWLRISRCLRDKPAIATAPHVTANMFTRARLRLGTL